ncbi:MAG TPA: TIGR04282 family arsenosugar biosynthesis glycosyltransferase [Gemmatimonadaceae bacterium]|nr:TIGR04282 family arsenosugar biosynthesis glycosyltransferase [Gemmatimonadaceae bacterium]
MSLRTLIIFARYPERGRVKTRLAAELGDDGALAVYRDIAGRVIDVMSGCSSYRTVVAYTPAHRAAGMRRWLGAGPTLRAQSEGDLGARMAEAIEHALSKGARRVVVIGTDCPDLDPPAVERAFQLLDESDVVFGPARDGGYYLIGVSRPHVALFTGIPWSTPDTLGLTLERAVAAGLSVALLDTRRDIDTAADWRDWCAERERAADGGA